VAQQPRRIARHPHEIIGHEEGDGRGVQAVQAGGHHHPALAPCETGHSRLALRIGETTSATIASARTVPRARPPARTVPTRPGWAYSRQDRRSRYEVPRRPPRLDGTRGRECRTSPTRSGAWSAGPGAVAREDRCPRGAAAARSALGWGRHAPPRRRRAAFAALAQPSSPGSRYAVHERKAHRQARSPTAGGRQRHGGNAGRRGGCSTQCRSLVPVRGDTGRPPHGNRARSCMVAASAPLTRLP